MQPDVPVPVPKQLQQVLYLPVPLPVTGLSAQANPPNYVHLPVVAGIYGAMGPLRNASLFLLPEPIP
jgi:hypothetical protein